MTDLPIVADDPAAQIGIIWTDADRIDRPADEAAGYGVYARADGSDYVFGLASPTPIGPGTTLWFNTDLNRQTGLQVFGSALGAEYEVSVAGDGSVNLYSVNAAGTTTLVHAGLTAAISTDGTQLDFRAPMADMGNPGAIETLVAINGGTALPGDFSTRPFTVVNGPSDPASRIGIAWTEADRIDRPADEPVGYQVYARADGGDFVFRLIAPIEISAGTTLWFNTDGNTATGFNIFGDPTGLDYSVGIALDGTVSLYSLDANGATTLVRQNLPAAFSTNGTELNFRLPAAAVGNPSSISTLIDVNYNNYVPNGFWMPPFTVTKPSGVADPAGQIGVTWTAADRIDRPAEEPAGYQLYARADASDYAFQLVAPTAIGPGTTLWFNTDGDTQTGLRLFSFALGAEYEVSVASDGTVNLYSVDASGATTLVHANLTAAISTDGTQLDFRAPMADMGNPGVVETLIEVNGGTALPTDFTVRPFTVVNGPSDPAARIGVTWTPADRIDRPAEEAAGYQVSARADGGDFVFGLKAPGEIGAGTTVWLNIDRNSATGYQIFSYAGGAEFSVNVMSDGTVNLYSLDATTGAQTLVAGNLRAAFSTDGTELDFRVPKAAIGNPNGIDTLVAINGNAFLPENFSLAPFTVFNDLNIVRGPATRIAIVYSASTAANYFSGTAYSQLFMSAQSAARAAGIPFDILTESDLTNLAKLVQYKTIVFPSFRNVQAADAVAIGNTLQQASQQYGVGLIASGEFMTNDVTGAPLPGDPYARMKTLFDATRVNGGFPADVTINATDTTGMVLKGYAPGELIHSYSGVGWNAFASVSGAATSIATETIGGSTYAAALAEQHGGRNVLFSSEGVMSDSNLLWQAVNYSVNGSTGPSVGLQMTRDSSIVAARIDMDQSSVLGDVSPGGGAPGIYDTLLPILAQWKSDFNFVGSYYLNIGNDPGNGLGTNWGVSLPYYASLLAMGNELGDHSYTHPEDTNVLTPAQIEFQFAQSKLKLEQKLSGYLGYAFHMAGAAVPGAPETLATSSQIIQYADYLTGGYSSVGSGYPNAFGYLTPDLANKVYIAPNTVSDFTLIDFQHMNPGDAGAAWAQEWTGLTSHAQAPIVVWPFHDYGPTSWDINGDGSSNYTTQMYTDWIARASAAGAEFITLGDLASRISNFSGSNIVTSVNGDTVTATVTSPDASHFALKVSGAAGQVIQNVAGWYAYNSDHVFLPTTGGTYSITLGATTDDVTHITALPMRSALLDLTGDGRDLSFLVYGDNTVTVAIATPGTDWISVTGASIASRAGDVLTLDLGAVGLHGVALTYAADQAPVLTSNGGGPTSQISVTEGLRAVTTVAATDPNAAYGDTLTYSLAAGADASLFSIDASTGALSFTTAPDYDNPGGTGRNNVYTITAVVTDAHGAATQQAITVSVIDAPPTLTTPVIDGVAQKGQVLTALADPGEADTTVTYQWLSSTNGGYTYSPISGATEATYQVLKSDEGALIEVIATVMNDQGATISVTSAPTLPVTDAPPTVTTPTIYGVAQEGQVLSASASSGPGGGAVTYQWLSLTKGGNTYSPITGATKATYKVLEGDEGALIEVIATSTNDQGAMISMTSDPTQMVTDALPTITTPVIDGTAQEGLLLTATAISGQLDNSVSYQWWSSTDGGQNYSRITGATAATYRVTEADEGVLIEVVAKATNEQDFSISKTSDPTKPVIEGAPPSLLNGGGAIYAVGGGAVAIMPSVILNDTESATVNSARVAITGGLLAGDTLNFVNQAGIIGAFDAANGVLSLTGSAGLATYQMALASITYTSTAHDPTGGNTDLSRALSVTVDDGQQSSNALPVSLTLIKPPGVSYVLTTGGTILAGGGDDTITAPFSALGAADTVDAGPGFNTLILQGVGKASLAVPNNLANFDIVYVNEAQGTTGAFAAAGQVITLRKDMNAKVTVLAPSPLIPGSPSGITIVGAANSAVINLGAGTDIVTLGSVRESVIGGAGPDTVNANASTAGAVIKGGAGTMTMNVTGGGSLVLNALDSGVSALNLAAAGSYSVDLNHAVGLTVTDKGKAADKITGVVASDTINAGAASVRVRASAAEAGVKIIGGTGVDVLELTTGGIATLNAATTKVQVALDEATILTLSSGVNIVTGSTGDDTINATLANVTATMALDGSGGTNTLSLTGAGAFKLATPKALTNIQVIDITEGQAAFSTLAATNQTVTLKSFQNFTVNVLAPTVFNASNPNPAGVTIIGANDSDLINLGGGADTVTLGSADETVKGGTGAGVVNATMATVSALITGGGGTSTMTVNVSGGGACGLNTFDSGINTVFLKASAVAWNFTANAEAGLTIKDQSSTLDTITAGGAGQTITGGAAGKLVMVAAAQGGTTFSDTAKLFNGDTIKNFATTADAGNVIDITDISFSKLTTATFTEIPAGTQGQLKLSDGTHTATVTLFGQFVAGMNTITAAAAGFIIASDGGTGVSITHPLAVPH